MSPLPSLRPAYRSQGGFSLIVTLLMLVVIAILGIGATNMALNDERGARNDRDRQIAFQAAEAALKDAEQEITTGGVPCNPNDPSRLIYRGRTTDTCFDGISSTSAGFDPACSQGTVNPGLCIFSDPTTPVWETVDFYDTSTQARTVQYGTFTNNTFPNGGGSQSGRSPRYIIELVPAGLNVGQAATTQSGGSSPTLYLYRITAIGYGPGGLGLLTPPNAQVVLQSVVNVLN